AVLDLIAGRRPAVGRPTMHLIAHGDARDLSWLQDESLHLVVTSPPYGLLKTYEDAPGQLGNGHDPTSVEAYESFLDELDRCFAECRRVLVPGGRICCVVGDICLSRRAAGRHLVLPLPADIQVRARRLGLDNLTPIRWLKVANIKLEASSSSWFLGKPNLPGGIVKNDIETIVMLRKPGGYRKPTPAMERESRISTAEYRTLFSPVWEDVRGESTRRWNHPAPYPEEISSRLIRMFSFAGDTVLDPFAGSGTTAASAIAHSRQSISVEIVPAYIETMQRRLGRIAGDAQLYSGEMFPYERRAVPA
ncbi:MAG TPA: site-specific DNA-methyltransferase, partial [Gaiellales bacterium]|nr:site-specific DNA-methyltransferase [Gaiellales bacterium]